MRDRWSNATIALHWLSALALIGLAVVGDIMSELPAAASERLVLARLHTVGGATVMLLTLARLLVRWRGPAVAPLAMPALHRRGIAAVHLLLYVAIFGLGASGMAMGALSQWPDYVAGQLPEAPALDALAVHELHETLVGALAVLAALHVVGVLVQQVRGGGILQRMRPG